MKFENLDIIFFSIIALSSLFGLYKGLIKIAISLLSSIAILYLTYIFIPLNSSILSKYIANELLSKIVAVIGFYIILSIIASFMLNKIYKLTENVSGSLVDRFLGLIIGFARGLFLAFAGFLVLIVVTGADYKNARNVHDILVVEENSLPKWIFDSRSYDTMNLFLKKILPLLPESILDTKIKDLQKNNNGNDNKEKSEEKLEKTLKDLMIKK
jgi:uncharacterized membrane protein required for colicin V production